MELKKLTFVLTTILFLSACNDDNKNSTNNKQVKVWTLPVEEFPVGEAKLSENRQKINLITGVEQYRIVRGYASIKDGYEAEIGLASNETEALVFENALAKLGYKSKRVIPPNNSQAGKNTSFWVRGDSRFSSKTRADEIVAILQKEGFTQAKTRYTAEDGLVSTGPWVINVLAVHPTFTGKLKSALGTDIIPEKETTTALANRLGAFAAINAGFFVVNEMMGTPGDLAGLSVIDGRIVSEGVEGRPAMFFENISGKRQTHLETNISTVLTITNPQGLTHRVDGINRTPGKNFNCGNPSDTETSVALHDVVCTDPNEIIIFTGFVA